MSGAAVFARFDTAHFDTDVVCGVTSIDAMPIPRAGFPARGVRATAELLRMVPPLPLVRVFALDADHAG
jgi:hypothetical protein